MKKKILGLLFAFCLIIPCAFMFVGCSDSGKLSKQVDELKQQVQTLTTEVDRLEQQLADLQSTNENLQSELNSITAFYELKKDEPFSIVVKVNDVFVVSNVENSCYLYLTADNSVSLQIENFASDGFCQYCELNSGSYTTPGAGIYRIKVVSISNATETQITLDLTEQSR